MARRTRGPQVINVINVDNTPEKQYGDETTSGNVKAELVALIANDVRKKSKGKRSKKVIDKIIQHEVAD